MKIISLGAARDLGLKDLYIIRHSGYGDIVMLGACARAAVIQRKAPVLICARPGMYDVLHGVDDGLDFPIYVLDGFWRKILCTNSLRKLARYGIKVHYFRYKMGVDRRLGLVELIAAGFGLSGRVNVTPHISADDKKGLLIKDRPQIAIMSGGNPLKATPVDILEKIVKKYGAEYGFVQIGTREDPLLSGALDMRGKLSMGKGIPDVLAASKLFIGSEGGLYHIARAVQTSAVVSDIFPGGFTAWNGTYHAFPRDKTRYKDEYEGAEVYDIKTLRPHDMLALVDLALSESDAPIPDDILDITGIEPIFCKVHYKPILLFFIKYLRALLFGDRNRLKTAWQDLWYQIP
ncbi:MAG: hypothetical protein FWG39_02055 [Alphaproteobacteria bacterium]|nr:hypothetical protein [Alphaproteobacteria bacterium]